jgi:hypothetical protein
MFGTASDIAFAFTAARTTVLSAIEATDWVSLYRHWRTYRETVIASILANGMRPWIVAGGLSFPEVTMLSLFRLVRSPSSVELSNRTHHICDAMSLASV